MRPHDLPAQPLSSAQLRVIAEAATGRARPMRLHGWATTIDPATGEILSAVRSQDQPSGYLLVSQNLGLWALNPALTRRQEISGAIP